jgi:protease I
MALRAVSGSECKKISKGDIKMATDNLKGVKVGILVTDGFEQVELTEPRKALQQAGAETQIVSPKSQTVRGWNFTDWGEEFPVDVALDRTEPEVDDEV